jgi:hypothetical protein
MVRLMVRGKCPACGKEVILYLEDKKTGEMLAALEKLAEKQRKDLLAKAYSDFRARNPVGA